MTLSAHCGCGRAPGAAWCVTGARWAGAAAAGAAVAAGAPALATRARAPRAARAPLDASDLMRNLLLSREGPTPGARGHDPAGRPGDPGGGRAALSPDTVCGRRWPGKRR